MTGPLSDALALMRDELDARGRAFARSMRCDVVTVAPQSPDVAAWLAMLPAGERARFIEQADSVVGITAALDVAEGARARSLALHGEPPC